ncbi:MAG: patatin-like phospholipase family protein [Candidatus Delongbacteria bacterium]
MKTRLSAWLLLVWVVCAGAAPPPPRFALALGGGAALGYAHLGVLEVLEEEGLRPDLVLGTSIGSIMGGLYCAGLSPAEIANRAEGMNLWRIGDLQWAGLGLLEWNKVRRQLAPLLLVQRLEDCPLPLICVATDLASGERVMLRRGPLLEAMLASATVPGLFEPIVWEGRLLVDGGLTDEVPVLSAREAGAAIVVAVDVSHPLLEREIKGPVDVLRQSYFIIQKQNVEQRRALADLVIRPDLTGLDFHAFDDVQAGRQAGREAALRALPQLKGLLRERGWQARR